jgi:hypothetical protein
LDSKNRRLYGDGSDVIDIDHDSIVGQLPRTIGHSYAIAPDLGRGITRRGAVFDLTTLEVLYRGSDTSGADVAYDATTRLAFVVKRSTAVVDPATGEIVGQIALPANPGPAALDSRGHLFISLHTDSIIRIDTRTRIIGSGWTVAPCGEPGGLALDERHGRLFVSCLKELLIVDTDDGHICARVPVRGRARQLGFDEQLALIYNPNGDGTMTVIHQDSRDHYSVAGQVSTFEAVDAATIDEQTHRAYLLRRATTLDRHPRVLVFQPAWAR